MFQAQDEKKLIQNLRQGGQSLFDNDSTASSSRKTICFQVNGASLVTLMVQNLPEIWETWVQSLGWEDPLEKGKATHSSILAWRIPQTEEPCGL